MLINEHLVFRKARVQKDYEHSTALGDLGAIGWLKKISESIELLEDAHLCAPRGAKSASGYYSVEVLDVIEGKEVLVTRLKFMFGADILPLRHELVNMLSIKIEQYQLNKVISEA